VEFPNRGDDSWANNVSAPGVDSLYDVLQVSPRAHQDVISAAYRVLARLYHPDVSAALTAAQQMQALNEAYVILSDPKRRARHDAERLWQARDTVSAHENRRSGDHLHARASRARPGRTPRPPDDDMPSSARTVVVAVLATLLIGITMALWVTFDLFGDGFDPTVVESTLPRSGQAELQPRSFVAPLIGDLEETDSFGSVDPRLPRPSSGLNASNESCRSSTPWRSPC